MGDFLKVAFVIIGGIIGAGFASGEEIYIFFYTYGKKGILGIIVCSILIGVIIYKSLNLINKNEINDYKEFLQKILKCSGKRNYLNVSYITNIVINIFLLITFYIMIAGFGAYFKQELNISNIFGSSILAILCLIILMTSVKGVVKVSSILIPMLITFILIIGLKNIFTIDLGNIGKNIIGNNSGNWLVESIIYCSYNSILLIPVLIALKKYLKDKKQITIISIISAVSILILAISIYMLLVKVDVNFLELEMPAVYVISKFFPQFKTIYGFIILVAIFTTSISIGLSFLNNTTKNKKRYTQIGIIMCITSIIISNFGFSNLVKALYPMFGYIGIVQILLLLKN